MIIEMKMKMKKKLKHLEMIKNWVKFYKLKNNEE